MAIPNHSRDTLIMVTQSSSLQLPSFAWMLAIGWVPVILAVVVAVSPELGHHAQLLEHAVFLGGYMLTTIPLLLAHRTLWRHRVSVKRSIATLAVASLLLAFAAPALLQWLAVRLGRASGPFQWHHVIGSFPIFWFLLLGFSAMIMVAGYYVSMKAARLRAVEAAALARDAELRALRYQLHPHFLFNTLNAISTLVVEERTREATRMIARLADFLRATLQGKGDREVALAEEIALTQQYLDIEKVRLGDRLTVTVRASADTLQAAVPWLLLQPLVENAIRHGITQRRTGGEIQIHARRNSDRLHIAICNDIPADFNVPTTRDDADASALGLRNVCERLQKLYGTGQRLQLNAVNGCCEVHIDLPFRVAATNTWATST